MKYPLTGYGTKVVLTAVGAIMIVSGIVYAQEVAPQNDVTPPVTVQVQKSIGDVPEKIQRKVADIMASTSLSVDDAVKEVQKDNRQTETNRKLDKIIELLVRINGKIK